VIGSDFFLSKNKTHRWSLSETNGFMYMVMLVNFNIFESSAMMQFIRAHIQDAYIADRQQQIEDQ
jgi:hypothetical protein